MVQDEQCVLSEASTHIVGEESREIIMLDGRIKVKYLSQII